MEDASQPLPRVLHLGFDPIGAPTNTGLTLQSMFRDWTSENLLQVALPSRQDFSAVPNVLVASPWIAPVDAMLRKAIGRNAPQAIPDGLGNGVARRQPLPWRLRLGLAASTLNDLGPVRVPRDVHAAVERFRPDVIHSLLGSSRALRVAHALSEKHDLPVVPHIMDDWLGTKFADGRLFGLARARLESQLESVIDAAPLLIVISEEMAAEYSVRYGKPCAVVSNSFEEEQFRGRPVTTRRKVLLYVGGLHLGRDDVIARVAEALRRVDGGWVLELHVPSSDSGRAEVLQRAHANVRAAGSSAPAEVPGLLREAAALLFVESTDPDIYDFTRLSISTKVPQYLAARRPILAVGPAGQSSVRAVGRSPLGHYGGEGDLDILVPGLESVARASETELDRDRDADYERWLRETFSAEAVCRRFATALIDAASAAR